MSAQARRRQPLGVCPEVWADWSFMPDRLCAMNKAAYGRYPGRYPGQCGQRQLSPQETTNEQPQSSLEMSSTSVFTSTLGARAWKFTSNPGQQMPCPASICASLTHRKQFVIPPVQLPQAYAQDGGFRCKSGCQRYQPNHCTVLCSKQQSGGTHQYHGRDAGD